MLRVGELLRFKNGRLFKVLTAFTPGGQGEAYEVREDGKHTSQVLKLFRRELHGPALRARLEWLVARRIHSLSPPLIGPDAIVDETFGYGCLMPLAPGTPLEKVLECGGFSFVDGVQLALTVSLAMAALHACGMSWGDPHANNILVERDGDSVLKPGLIDFDNYSAPGVPPPPGIGHHLYMASELRGYLLGSSAPATPCIETDLYALAVLIHEILLLRHPSSKIDPDEFNDEMCEGVWIADPMRCAAAKTSAGYPIGVLNADLARLFRYGLGKAPSRRPSAMEWAGTLKRGLACIYLCDHCEGPFLIDPSKLRCPLCEARFSDWVLVLRNGRKMALTAGTTVLGRSELGSPKVSTRHAIFRKIGPEYFVENISGNGVFRKSKNSWKLLDNNKTFLLQPGDVLKFADVEGTLTTEKT